MRPGRWKFQKDFDVLSTHGQGFIEGNSWNYSFFVPQNPDELIKMMGGKKKFASKLDELFTMHLPDEFLQILKTSHGKESSEATFTETNRHIMLLTFIMGRSALENPGTNPSYFGNAI
jgi:hypothetical protein